MIKKQLSILEESVKDALLKPLGDLDLEEYGIVLSLDRGIVIVKGLYKVKYQELVEFSNGILGMVYNLNSDRTGIILLGNYENIRAGDRVKRTYKVASIPVSEDYLGRVINPLGKVLDEKGPIDTGIIMPVEREAPPIMHRAPINKPLQTGIKVIDSIVPVGKGQRELILGDRQTGKTAIAIDTIINQKDKNVICIYCSIAQQISSVSKIIDVLKTYDALSYTIVVMAGAEDPPGLAYIAPYAATTIAEFFMENGHDVLIIYDDLTKHARAYRELSLLLERPSGRESYPGDIFYIHSRLLERSTHLKPEYGGGSITALPIIETQAENLSSYIPTNLISITDGQIYLSPKIFQKGNIPAVDIGTSVSRVGGKTQIPAYRQITTSLKLTYSQFSELEVFSTFSARLDEKTKIILERGKRIRKVLNQAQYKPIDVTDQIAVLIAVLSGLFDDVDIEMIGQAEKIAIKTASKNLEFQLSISELNKIDDRIRDDFLKETALEITKELVNKDAKSKKHR
ncbi:F0F1 ATP synthase subunit alpha [Proteocatella sphenisci]|uniref:F0F1 ATP synthase subunit alpha n=1 Tax=Proteocatella sphenisci TaxID=181070 RepID=UPI00049019FE|nr:F0F1 ATP synthase subunit alpha [Proteocatella sphenisci]